MRGRTAPAGAGLLLGRMSHVQSGRPGRECADDGAWIGTQLREFGAHGNSTHNDEIPYLSTLTQVKARAGPTDGIRLAGKRRDGFTSVTSPPFIMPVAGSASSCPRPRVGYACTERPVSARYHGRCPAPWRRPSRSPSVRLTGTKATRRTQATGHGEPRPSPTPRAFGDSHQHPSEPASVRPRRTTSPAGGRRRSGPARGALPV